MELKAAKKSPRIDETGAICWYEGDAFEITLHFSIKDDAGNPAELPAEAEIHVMFYDQENQEIWRTASMGDTVQIGITDEVTAKFPRGCYRYDAVLVTDYRTTLMKRNEVIVE